MINYFYPVCNLCLNEIHDSHKHMTIRRIFESITNIIYDDKYKENFNNNFY